MEQSSPLRGMLDFSVAAHSGKVMQPSPHHALYYNGAHYLNTSDGKSYFNSSAEGAWKELEERQLQLIIPLTFSELFGQRDNDILNEIGLTPIWFLEYVMCVWVRLNHQLVEGLSDEAYEATIDDLHEHLSEHVHHHKKNWAQVFPFYADELMQLVIRLHQVFKPFLGRVPEGDEQFSLTAVNVERVGPDTITILMVFDNRGKLHTYVRRRVIPTLLPAPSGMVFAHNLK